MAVSTGYREFVIEQLEQAARDIHWKRMFGGVGIYCGDDFFALLANDRLYFKVDDQTRPTFEAEGMEPFRPYGDTGGTMGYYEVPLGVIEAPDELRTWVRDAVAVAQRRAASTNERQPRRTNNRQPRRTNNRRRYRTDNRQPRRTNKR